MAQRVEEGNEPIAIVGIGCRLPGGVGDPEQLWQFLCGRGDAVGEVPDGRWDPSYYGGPTATAGRIRTRFGAFLQATDEFDAEFFSIPEDQAAQTDPKQRMLLEVAWESLEDAHMLVDDPLLRDFGVFVGLSGNDYAVIQHRHVESVGAFSAVGAKHYMGPNRISYQFDLRGPSVAIDAACATGAAALATACGAIWAGACQGALVGAANDMHDPSVSISFSQLGTISPDGRCKPFSADADGYGRGEGVVVLVVRRLTEAVRHANHIYACVRGVAMGHGGRNEEGWAAPRRDAQADLISRALERSRTSPDEIAYVEAHGTGTRVGDRIEAQSISAALRGAGRRDVIPIGSVKSNFGHGEAVAGLTAVAKVALMLERGRLAPSLHSHPPNDEIDFDALALRVVSEEEVIPPERSVIGVNSFGVGGTNVHVLLEAHLPDQPDRGECAQRLNEPTFLPVSAAHPRGLEVRLDQVSSLISSSDCALADVALTLAEYRTHHAYRRAFIAASPDQLVSDVADAANTLKRSAATPARRLPKIAFVFTGMGPQHPGMGSGLWRHEAFSTAIRAVDREWRRAVGWSVAEELALSAPASRIGTDTAVSMVANFTLQVGLIHLWRAWGVSPTAVLGHSVGEMAAAYCAGISLSELAPLLKARVAAVEDLKGLGIMAAVALSSEEVRPYLEGLEERCGVAAVNSHRSVTLAGDEEAVRSVLAAIGPRAFTRVLDVDVPFHSPQLRARLGSYRPSLETPTRPLNAQPVFVSGVAGRVLDASLPSGYWVENFAEPVHLAGAVAALVETGCHCFVEVGPHPVLRHALGEELRHRGIEDPTLVASQLRDAIGDRAMLEALGRLYEQGVDPKWAALRQAGARPARLPTYPFQRRRFWNESEYSRRHRLRPTRHPLLGEGIRRDERTHLTVVENEVHPRLIPWLADHQLHGRVVFPGAGYLEMVNTALRGAIGAPVSLADVRLPQPLPVEDRTPIRLEVRLDHSNRSFELSSIGGPSMTPRLHAKGRWTAVRGEAGSSVDLASVRVACDRPVPIDEWYDDRWHAGSHYGADFRTVVALWEGNGEVLARVALPAKSRADQARYGLYPPQLDGVLQAAFQAVGRRQRQGVAVPMGFRRITSHVDRLPEEFWAHVTLRSQDGRNASLDAVAFDDRGTVILEIQAYERTLVSPGPVASEPREWLYEESWSVLSEPGRERSQQRVAGTWIILDRERWLSRHLTSLFEEAFVFERWPDDGLPDDPAGLVFVAPTVHHPPDEEPDAWFDATCTLTSEYLAALRGALDGDVGPVERIVLITRGAVGIEGDAPSLFHSGVFGLNRVAASEFPDVRTTTIDVPLDADPRSVARRLTDDAVLTESKVDERVLTGDRWRRSSVQPHTSARQELADLEERMCSTDQPVRVESSANRGFEGLRLVSASKGHLSDNGVRVRVHAASLNFRDVLKVLGEYPRSAGEAEDTQLGDECAGVVVEVGRSVTSVCPGSRVVVKIGGSLTSVVQAPEPYVFPIPDTLSFIDAVTIPVAFLTAERALVNIARVRSGQRCLIHSAAGGVGLAALQVARRAGAEVLASAGTPQKRRFLQHCGASLVTDSRALTFESDVMRYTEGWGVDIVLNSLAGDFIHAGLRCLRSGGHFVEIGKRDVARNTRVGLQSLERNVSLHVVDLARSWREEPRAMGERVSALLQRTSSGVYRPLPTTVFDASKVSDAFRFMAQGGHVGKVVVDFTKNAVPAVRLPGRPAAIVDSRSSYLITGGLGGLGLAFADRLAREGAGRIVLLSRRDQPGDVQSAIISEIEAHGAVVVVARGDAGEQADVQRAVALAEERGHRLGGVIHAAGVLEDALIQNLTPDPLRRVARPKVLGALRLHAATSSRDLAFFVLCSSAAVTNGNGGQGSYVAANRFLDDFAAWRRSQGLRATSINWGPISDVGMSADGGLLGRFAATGQFGIHSQEASGLLWRCLTRDVGCAVVMATDFGKRFASRDHPSRFDALVGLRQKGEAVCRSLRETLVSGDDDPLDLLLWETITTAAKLRGVPPTTISGDDELGSIGLDSLMLMELASWIRHELGVDGAALSMRPDQSLRALASALLEQVVSARS